MLVILYRLFFYVPVSVDRLKFIYTMLNKLIRAPPCDNDFNSMHNVFNQNDNFNANI